MRRVVALLSLLGIAGCRAEEKKPTPGEGPARSAGASVSARVAPNVSATVDPVGSASATAPTLAAPTDATVTLSRDGRRLPAAEAERVIHVGDSMVPLVGFYLRKLYWEKKRKYWIVAEDSSSTLSWDNERKLRDAMYRYDPDLILISLGSNELFDREPERRAGAIRRLVADTHGRACLWIGPPAWKKDYGFLRVLERNLGHCAYFDSTKLALPRMEDGRHPSWTGGHRWARAVWQRLGGTRPVPAGNVNPGADPSSR